MSAILKRREVADGTGEKTEAVALRSVLQTLGISPVFIASQVQEKIWAQNPKITRASMRLNFIEVVALVCCGMAFFAYVIATASVFFLGCVCIVSIGMLAVMMYPTPITSKQAFKLDVDFQVDPNQQNSDFRVDPKVARSDFEIIPLGSYVDCFDFSPLPGTVSKLVKNIISCCPRVAFTIVIIRSNNRIIDKVLYARSGFEGFWIAEWRDS